MPVPDLVVVGAGGFAREVAQVADDLVAQGADWTMLGYLDDDPARIGTNVGGRPVLGPPDWLADRPDVWAVVGIGNPRVRHAVVARLAGHTRWATLVHPRAWTGARVSVGPGSVVCAGACLTVDIVLGDHAHVNLNVTVGHDAMVGTWVTLNPGAHVSGAVRIGDGVEVGTGAAVIQGRDIGAWATVGAGAVVSRDVEPGAVVVGVPARAHRHRPAPPGWSGSEA